MTEARRRRGSIARGIFLAACLLAAAALAGCATFEDLGSGPSGAPATVQIFEVRPIPAQASEASGGDEVRYSLDTITIPPGHRAGTIERPRFGSTSPDEDFVLAGSRSLEASAFLQEVAIHVSGRVGSSRDILVFVHGFNTSPEDAQFRLAQIAADSHFGGVAVLFNWHSRQELFAYESDKESATASRDALEQLIAGLAGVPGVGRVHVLAHSMGAWLAMEALRQNAIAGRADLGGHLGEVMLAAPDIDLAVFRQQVARLGERDHVSIFVSSGDRALSLSSELAGRRPRVGALNPEDPSDKAELDRLGVKVYDLSAVADGFLDHAAYADAPEVLRSIGLTLTASRPEDANVAAVPGNGVDRPLEPAPVSAAVTSTPLAAPAPASAGMGPR